MHHRYSAIRRWRLFLIVIAAAMISSCSNHPLSPPNPAPERTTNLFVGTITKKLDLMFAVDDSPSMSPLISKMLQNFPKFMDVLKNTEGGLPDVHIAVVSQNLGAGQWTGLGGCPIGGDQGLFLTAMHPPPGQSSCPVPKDHFISASADGSQNNFTGDIDDVFTCIANLGDQGCGFEHQLESVRRALGGSPGVSAPPANAGFLRDDAILAVIWLTNEDDCSAPSDTPLFDPNMGLTDTYGPLQSYRCNEFGHSCNGAQPPRTKAEDNLVCMDAGTAPWQRLFPVADYIKFFSSIKKEPHTFLPAAIAAPPTPYSVHLYGVMNYMTGKEEMWPYVVHSCGDQNPPGSEVAEYGDPAVRLKQVLDAFGGDSVFESICSADFSAPLVHIANVIGQHLGAQCVVQKLVDTDLNTPGVQPDCVITDRVLDTNGNTIDGATIPSCAAMPAAIPCWSATDDPQCGQGKRVVINRGPTMPQNTAANVQCAVCVPNSSDPGCTY